METKDLWDLDQDIRNAYFTEANIIADRYDPLIRNHPNFDGTRKCFEDPEISALMILMQFEMNECQKKFGINTEELPDPGLETQ